MGAVEKIAVAAEPLFSSAHAALKFAFNYTHGNVKKRPLYALAAGAAPAGKGLGGLDGAAQAGMILAELSVLTSVRRKVIEARFLPQSAPCACRSPCCRGARECASWGEAISWLTEYALQEGLTGTVSHYRLRRALVVRYFGVRESFIAIADACGINRHTASEYNKRVVEHLRAQERPAMYELEARLKQGGLVES